ncbi:hypothetical protein PLESTB_000511400 [Pleodorina starrii]|uniref:Uncharacterized protein n=1 Tax=Pleodorina starrii TaxID=330485 RepID=A0A9W6BGU0_9CHLO|nr:hypothetical protein PLESTB_000511400 [Pleodorina starrii]GLC75048.1 hypothetical protein PLESTF_001587200 [Pleodorina starrii]
MEFAQDSYLTLEAPALEAHPSGAADEQSVQEAIERIEPFLKGQGYIPIGGSLRVLNATATEACHVLDLIFRLASQQQQDDRMRNELRDQADKGRVALAHAQKKNEALDESNRRLMAQVKELEGKLLAAKHKSEEQERELKQKLQSTTARLNGYLYGGRDAGKRTVAGAGGGGGAGSSAGTGGPRRVTPAYDRFRDDPAEAAAATQKLEAELSQLKQANARLKKQLAAAREQLGASPRTLGAGDSPGRDGQRGDQLPSASETGGMDIGNEQGSGKCSSLDMQSVRSSLADVSGAGASSASGEVMRLQRLVRELKANSEQQQRQVEKAAADRSELHKTLASLRSKCASLEVERKNAEDRFLRAQRATAALLEPAVAEAQTSELRAKLAAAERELHEANKRADGLKERLAAAEVELESNQRHVGVLKRAIRALPKGQPTLEELGKLLTEELQPLHDQLRDARAELEAARAQSQRALGARNDEPSCAGGVASVAFQGPSSSGGQANRTTSDGLPLSPAMPLPSSPPARFDGFKTRTSPLADSPPLVMQPPPVHAFYSRAYSSTMPCERLVASSSTGVDDPNDPNQQPRLQGELSDHGAAGATSGGTQPGAVGAGGVSSAFMRRSMSAGVSNRTGDSYTSADRQRARWQVHNPQARQRFPSPIDILLEQARNPIAEDATISITAGPNPEAHAGAHSLESTP